MSRAVPAREPARPARRVQPPSWRDARLLVGLALVLAAVVLGSVVVARARATTAVLALARPVPAGQVVRPDDLAVADVRLGSLADHYLGADARPREGSVAARDLHAGDLLAKGAVVPAAEVARRRIVVPVRAAVASALVRGSVVEVWVSDRTSTAGTERFGAPRRVLTGAGVADPLVGSASTPVGGQDTTNVALWVPQDAVAGMLTAVDRRSTIALVPQPGSLVEDHS